ncbi:MAG: bifunctional ornithine acetyltransferase/N-acetylglutamate synthase, partial [Planctomycetaceae bacterium]
MAEIKLPQGFQAAGVMCGLKAASQQRDLAIFVSRVPAVACGVFTQNRVCGAPVQISRARVPADHCRAVIVNSGNANACTGSIGLEHAREMTEELARLLNCDSRQVLVCSTGVIGQELPIDRIRLGIPACFAELDSHPIGLEHAAQAMMTTDTVHKIASRQLQANDRTLCVTGVAKGAAMIAPNMATMLAVIMTDARLDTATADS